LFHYLKECAGYFVPDERINTYRFSWKDGY